MEIDFLFNVLGVRADSLEREAVEIIVPIRTEDGAGELAIPVMHPLHCLQSRVANVLRLDRTDDAALRQLGAAPIILERFVGELLAKGEVREAKRTLQALFDYLEGDNLGRQAHAIGREDPASIIAAFRRDGRFDTLYRWFNLRSMLRRIRKRRARQASVA